MSDERRLTREELRAGFLRLGVILAALLVSAVAIGAVLASADGTSFRRGLANALAIVAAVVLVFALASWMRTGPLRREGLGARLAEDNERRESERLALGLVGIGVGLFVAALLIG